MRRTPKEWTVELVFSLLVGTIGIAAAYASLSFILAYLYGGQKAGLWLWVLGILAGTMCILLSIRTIVNIFIEKPNKIPRPSSLTIVGGIGIFQLITAYLLDSIVHSYMLFTAIMSLGFFALAYQQSRKLKT
jgi:hypothetical protein